METRSLYLLDQSLTAWPGVGIYAFDADKKSLTLVSEYSCIDQPHNFYEVSQIPQSGSWWLPTVLETAVPAAWQQEKWGGIEPLTVTGQAIITQVDQMPIVRPTRLLWWIPQQTLAQSSYVPMTTHGGIVGDFPETAPTNASSRGGDQPRAPLLEKRSEHMLYTYHALMRMAQRSISAEWVNWAIETAVNGGGQYYQQANGNYRCSSLPYNNDSNIIHVVLDPSGTIVITTWWN
ncbi:DUF4258 domain-containing protein [Chloroflexi bacterium TSY]|nr:DUF4258 domain-containing protein [Chloroflexi bacterium TSY]